jgi:hypothetical protein
MRHLVVAVGSVLLLAACSSDSITASGPGDLADGSYRLFAASSSGALRDQASLEIAGDKVVITQGADVVEATLDSATADSYVLCPPGGAGNPRLLDALVTIGSLDLARPALFGDCAQTQPVRVTVVDLDSSTDNAFPFTRWAEFCAVTDPDC